MPAISALRSQIDATCRSFIPPLFYLALFAAAYYSTLSSTSTTHDLNASISFLRQIKTGEAYQLASEVELNKALPFIIVILIAGIIYLFDRLIQTIGGIIPPYLSWRGSSVLYIRRNTMINFWLLVPEVESPAALGDRARAIVETARTAKQAASVAFVDRKIEKFSERAAGLKAAKSGVAWCAFLIMVELATRPAVHRPILYGSLFLFLFMALTIVNGVLMTWAHIAKIEAEVHIAKDILEMSGEAPDLGLANSQYGRMEKAISGAIRQAPRFLVWGWRRRFVSRNALWAITGFPTHAARLGALD